MSFRTQSAMSTRYCQASICVPMAHALAVRVSEQNNLRNTAAMRTQGIIRNDPENSLRTVCLPPGPTIALPRCRILGLQGGQHRFPSLMRASGRGSTEGERLATFKMITRTNLTQATARRALTRKGEQNRELRSPPCMSAINRSRSIHLCTGWIHVR